MLKKIVISVLIPLLLIQLYSCYSMNGISKEELIRQEEKSDIRIRTFNLETYEFKNYYYYIKSDTLFGIGEKITNEYVLVPFSGKIPIDDIEFVEASKFNTGTTCLVITGTTLILALVAAKMFFDALPSGCGQES